ncbi:hypothetical protein QVD17_36046 [Tagetes erecta]|uniref:Uncharacterized protein n=1 Tax=Tagetes erecta TaxID=13708 RepID=A0AAD8JRL6_TARER|nr:hypothetical protein QVD17_36046 [Tagetes erecta]
MEYQKGKISPGKAARLVPIRGEVKARICEELKKEVKGEKRPSTVTKKPNQMDIFQPVYLISHYNPILKMTTRFIPESSSQTHSQEKNNSNTIPKSISF